MSFKKQVKKFIKRIPFAKRFYFGVIVPMRHNLDTKIHEIDKMYPLSTDYKENRLNIIIPSVNTCHVFGGISTALKMFYSLAEELKWDSRIIISDCDKIDKDNVLKKEYKIVKEGEESLEKHQAVLYYEKEKGIHVGANDYFLTTSWWTCYNAESVIKWQKESYNQKIKPLLYMIQDYEPGFYPWSTQYLLAESTYHLDVPTYAIINSFELKEFLDINGYTFKESFAFKPVLNAKLKEYLPTEKAVKKEKKIIVYGRPSTARNAFNIVVAVLKRFCEIMPGADEWTFISAGEKHQDVELKNNIKLKSTGKMTLEEYANTLLTSYAGISLMVSPHPSYPPLEMSTFGVKTITNSFANRKDKTLNDNLLSFDNANPDYLAEQLKNICMNYNGEGTVFADNDYVNSTEPFGNVVKDVAKLLK